MKFSYNGIDNGLLVFPDLVPSMNVTPSGVDFEFPATVVDNSPTSDYKNEYAYNSLNQNLRDTDEVIRSYKNGAIRAAMDANLITVHIPPVSSADFTPTTPIDWYNPDNTVYTPDNIYSALDQLAKIASSYRDGTAATFKLLGGSDIGDTTHRVSTAYISSIDASPTFDVKFSGVTRATLTSTGNLTLSGHIVGSDHPSNRVLVTSTGGAFITDNLYWDATNDRLGIGSGASSPSYVIDAKSAIVGANLIINAENTDNTNGGSNARYRAMVGGASGGDPYIHFGISGVTDWSVGLDNSDSDAFIISESSTLGTNNRLRIASGGEATLNNRLNVGQIVVPAFISVLPSTDNSPSIYSTSDAVAGPNPFDLNGHLVLQARSGGGSGRDIIFYSGTTPTIRYRLNPSGLHTFTGNMSLSGTFSAGGLATLSGGALFDTVQGSAQGKIHRATVEGLFIRAIGGSTNDFTIASADAGTIFANPTGTRNVILGHSSGSVTIPGTLTISGSLTASGLSSGRVVTTSTGGLFAQDNLYWDATNDRLGIGAGASSPAGLLDLRESNTGTVQGIVFNSNNANAAAHARWQVTSGGSLGGDAYFQASISGVIDWAMGIDNSDSDAWVISQSTTLGTNNRLRIDTSGNVYTYGSTLSIGSGTGSHSFNINGGAGQYRELLFRTNGSLRWDLYTNVDAESGSNAGSSFRLSAYDDAGSIIDTPISIVRAAGGGITFSRPISAPSLTVSGLTANRLVLTDGLGQIAVNTSLTTNGFIYASGAGAIGTTAAATNGQLLIGSTSSNPVLGTLSGTTNQISIANGPGTITISTPQNIHSAATPTFSGLTLSALTAGRLVSTTTGGLLQVNTALITNGFIYAGGSGSILSTTTPTNGQLLIGTGGAPVAATLTGTANQITVTNGSGSITLSIPSTVNLTSVNVSGLSASQAVFTDGLKNLVSNAVTGTGNVVMSASPTLTGTINAVSMSMSGTLTLSADPTNALHAATKQYVDNVAAGLDLKASVRAATTGNITLSGPQTIDGVSVIAGDRVLVKNQSTGSQNGIYVVAAGAWSRSTDADSSAEVNPGMFTFIEEGTNYADTGWVLVTNSPITLGSTSLSFSQFSGAGSVNAGDGLTQSGITLNVVTASSSRIVVNPDSIDLALTGISAGTYTKLTVDAYGRATVGATLSSSDVNAALGLSPSLAVFTNGSGNLTTNAITGSGSVVMSASPTLTGTINAAAMTMSSSLTLNGETANRMLYLNSSKVVSTSSNLIWDGSTFYLTGSQVISADLTVSSLSSGRVPVIGTAGLITQDNLYWDASNDRLGIGAGASTPTYSLQVSDSISGDRLTLSIENTSGSASSSARFIARVNGASAGDPFLQLSVTGGSEWSAGVKNNDSDSFQISNYFEPGTNVFFKIDTSGNVYMPGYGASNRIPYLVSGSRFDITNNLTFDGLNLYVAGSISTGTLNLSTNPDGYYDDGSLQPSYSLAQTMASNDYWRIYGEGSSNAGQLVLEVGDDGNESIVFRRKKTYPTYSSIDSMTINGSGNVGIGTGSPSERLHVLHSSSGVDSTIRIEHTSNTAGSNAHLALRTAGVSSGKAFISFDRNYVNSWSMGMSGGGLAAFSLFKSIDMSSDEVMQFDVAGTAKFFYNVEVMSYISATAFYLSSSLSYLGPHALHLQRSDSGNLSIEFYTATPGQDWSVLADHSDSNKLKFRFDSTDVMTLDGNNNRVGVGTTSPDFNLHVYEDGSGLYTSLMVDNASTSSSSHARLIARVNGASAGNPFMQLIVNGANDWSVGLRNDDGDSFQISKNFEPGTNVFLKIDTSGNVYFPGYGTSNRIPYLTSGGRLDITNNLTFDGSNMSVAGSVTASGGVVFGGGGTNLNYHLETSWTATGVGFSGSVTATCRGVRVGNLVTIYIGGSLSGTSNATTFSITGLPVSLRPTQAQVVPTWMYDNGTIYPAFFFVSTVGTITVYLNGSVSGWTSSGFKGVADATSLSYLMI